MLGIRVVDHVVLGARAVLLVQRSRIALTEMTRTRLRCVMTDIIEFTRTCQECKTVEIITAETNHCTTELWSNFQRNLSTPYVCRRCLETCRTRNFSVSR